MGSHDGRRSAVPGSATAAPYAPRDEGDPATTLLATPGAPADLMDRLFTPPAEPESAARPSRGPDRTPSRPRSSRRRLLRVGVPLVSFLVIVAVAVAGLVVTRRALHSLKTPDYTGSGSGAVLVQVRSGDGASQIARTLHADDVVESTKAFVDAANDSGRSQDFPTGFFQLRHHMSAASAVAALLNPTARVVQTATIPEGLIEAQVLAVLARSTKISLPSLTAASKDLALLGLPNGFSARTAEGFLFPATYQFDPGVSASDVLQQMTTRFAEQDRSLHLVAAAAALRLTPYQLLTIASMVEAEARFPADRAKVARVVLNRLAKHMNLGFDSTTAYGLRIQGKDPRTATYQENSPYNTRLRPGLPPTPIGNPGAASLYAAAHPAAGNWLYFVSDDAAGHLFFTNDPAAFLAASTKCRKNKWGCT